MLLPRMLSGKNRLAPVFRWYGFNTGGISVPLDERVAILFVAHWDYVYSSLMLPACGVALARPRTLRSLHHALVCVCSKLCVPPRKLLATERVGGKSSDASTLVLTR